MVCGVVFLLWFLVAPQISGGDEGDKPYMPVVDTTLRLVTMQDIEGNEVQPLAPTAGHFSIVLFTATECPIANAFSPEIARIAKEYEKKSCELYLVYTDPDLDADSIRTHLKDYALTAVTAILDKEQVLVRATGATHTPEAAVVNSKGNQLYRGRVNNRYAALGKARRVITKNDLREALQAITNGNTVATPRTKVIGCYIPTLPISSATEN